MRDGKSWGRRPVITYVLTCETLIGVSLMKRFGKKTAAGLTVVLALVMLGAFAVNNYLNARAPDHHAYSSADLQDYLRNGKTVLVTVDADWAINPSDRPFFMSPGISKAIRQKGFVAMTADWTTETPEVDSLMAEIGRKEVPALVVFSPENPDSPIVFSRGDKESKIVATLQASTKP